MKHLSSRLVVLATASLAGAPLLAQNTEAPEYVEVPGHLEFTGQMTALPLQPRHAEEFDLSLQEIAERHDAAVQQLASLTLVEYVDDTDEYIFLVPDGMDENSIADALMAEGNFLYVEPNWMCYPLGCPNDTRFNNQWHHNANRMNSCAGWDIHTGNPTTVVAICDTGINVNHGDFSSHRQEGYNAVNQLWESQGGAINDVHGHGTNTTGCAAANGNDNYGVTGVGWNLGHRMMRVSNTSSGGSSMNILTHAARLASDVGDKVSNVSYSGVTSGSVQTAGTYIRNNGALLVWAAGNAGATYNGNREDSVIVVGATTSTDSLASFSNRGPFIDLVAPGQSVYTTSGGGWGSVSGTSFSSPLTAGLCGLMFSAAPSATPQEIEDALRAGCDDLGANGVDNIFGYGRIEVYNSLSLLDPCDPPSNICFTSANSASALGSVIAFNGSNSFAANDLELYSYNNPAGQFGIFFTGNNETLAQFGNGWLCVTGGIQRFPLQTIDAFGLAVQPVDATAIGGAVGVTDYFQFWFRDPAGGGQFFNLSDGLKVTWCD